MSDTPRTDKRCLESQILKSMSMRFAWMCDFARDLERENAALHAKLDHFVNPSTKSHSLDHATMREWNLANRNADLERENAALLEKLDASRKLLDIHLLRSDLFSYLAWLEDHRDHGDFNVKGKDYLVLASDSTTCWGRTFMEAVQIAEQHDRKLFDAARKEAQP